MNKKFTFKGRALYSVFLLLLFQVVFGLIVTTSNPHLLFSQEENKESFYSSQDQQKEIGKELSQNHDMDYRATKNTDQKSSDYRDYIWLALLISIAGGLAGTLFFKKNSKKKSSYQIFKDDPVSQPYLSVRKFIARKPKTVSVKPGR